MLGIPQSRFADDLSREQARPFAFNFIVGGRGPFTSNLAISKHQESEMRTKHLATENELSQNLVTTAWAEHHPTT